MRRHGKKERVQKKLVLCNVNELYKHFKDEHPTVKVGFSKFAELRPQHCILAGSAGTHTVCVCTMHQNVKLMLDGAKLATLTSQDELPMKSYRHCISRIMCNPPQPSCHFNTCTECPDPSELKKQMEWAFEETLMDTVSYKQCVATDRTTLENFEKTTDEFIEVFVGKLMTLKKYSFIAAQQNSYLNEIRNSLNSTEVIVLLDFSENYSFVIQDEVSGFHWNNNHATIHPFLIYYRDDKSEINSKSFVVISDCLKHDTVALHFPKIFNHFLKQNFHNIEKIYYFSDGATSQY